MADFLPEFGHCFVTVLDVIDLHLILNRTRETVHKPGQFGMDVILLVPLLVVDCADASWIVEELDMSLTTLIFYNLADHC